MTDEQRKVYDEAEKTVLKDRICPRCSASLYDIGARFGEDHMKGHFACPAHSVVYGDCYSVSDGRGGFLNESLWSLLFDRKR